MRATLMYKAGDVRVENVGDASIEQPTDALIRTVRSCICGSDLWPYKDLAPTEGGARMGHEALGVVEDLGSEVSNIKKGDLVIMPFAFSDGACEFCEEGLNTSCLDGGFFGLNSGIGAQAEAIRIPQAEGTLFTVPSTDDGPMLASLLTLSDVMGTGFHAALMAAVEEGDKVAVVGDGAVGLCGVIAAKMLGAEQIIIMGRHPKRVELARDFGATDVVSERGEEAAERVRELTGGHGVHAVLECVGSEQSMLTSMQIVRPGGAVGRVGVPHYQAIPETATTFFHNVTVSGGPAPVRAYIEDLLPSILDGTIDPGRVFDQTIGFDEVPDGYRAMNDRESLKVMIRP
ncbi:MAG: IMP dehydrogenase [Acidobacteria bacterium]|nr:MAG: IMP dehydrogenase [Acidobacteriota bacterium]